MIYIIFIIIFVAIIFVIIFKLFKSPIIFKSPIKSAGDYGEYIATNIIKEALNKDDYLLTNIKISYNDKPTELDNVVINKYGVFIIEVKNYKGILYGEEEDYNWKKYKDDGYGNIFVKEVRNPIKQVKRQVYILAKYLDEYNVWVKGYVLFIENNSPVQNEYVLKNIDDIDRVIHTSNKNHLNKQKIEEIKNMLSN